MMFVCRAGNYARVSTGDPQGIPFEIRALREYAARRGWTVARQVKEIGSGASARELREQIVEAARRRDIEVVLVWRLDRWGRSVTDLLVANGWAGRPPRSCTPTRFGSYTRTVSAKPGSPVVSRSNAPRCAGSLRPFSPRNRSTRPPAQACRMLTLQWLENPFSEWMMDHIRADQLGHSIVVPPS